MSNKKKIIIMSCLVALLAVTAVFNFVLAGAEEEPSAVTTANYFTMYRAERASSRSEEFVQLDSVIALYEEGSDKYNEAVDMKLKIVGIMENELHLETLIKSLGFSDAVVSIGYESDNINVFINSTELDYDSALSIHHLLKAESDIPQGNISIMSIYSES